jgi:tRNA1Val (adenine37-N6)-methyltransferase
MTTGLLSDTEAPPLSRVDETIDELKCYNLKLIQSKSGYRFSLDPLLLTAFAGETSGMRIADLGTGNGIIPLVLARMAKGSEFVGIEQHEGLADMAMRNVSLNGLEDRISIIHSDIIHIAKELPAASFDLVISNPPYRQKGSGKVSPRGGRDGARHELTAGLADFLAVAKRLVKIGGSICFIYHPSRLPQFMSEALALKLAPLRLRMVHGQLNSEAKMFMVELTKGERGELMVLPPLFVDSGYTTNNLP